MVSVRNIAVEIIVKIKIIILLLVFFSADLHVVSALNRPEKVYLGMIRTVESNNCPVLVVKSETGIGSIQLVGINKYIGKKLILRFQLCGLEHFMLVTEKLCFKLSVSSNTGEISQTLAYHPNGRELILGQENSMRFRVTHNKHKKYFDVEIPPTVTQYFGLSVKLSWIDFYR